MHGYGEGLQHLGQCSALTAIEHEIHATPAVTQSLSLRQAWVLLWPFRQSRERSLKHTCICIILNNGGGLTVWIFQ